MIQLRFCTLEFTDWGAQTTFDDTSSVDAVPHDTHHYAIISHRLGYGDDVLAYCQEHEFAHAFVAERLLDDRSIVLWGLAHGKPVPRGEGLFEEMAAQTFQRWLRANERPIISGADWDELKHDALELLSAATSAMRDAA